MPLMTIMRAEVPAADAGIGAGVANVTMQVGAVFGLAVLGTVAADHSQALVAQGHSVVSALTGGYQLGFTIAAALVATGLLIVIVALRSPAESGRRVAVARPEPADGPSEAA